MKEALEQKPRVNVFIYPFSKYILGIYCVLGTDINPGEMKFLLSGSLCSSEYLNMQNHNVSNGDKT